MHAWQRKTYLLVIKSRKVSNTLSALVTHLRKYKLSGHGRRTTQDIENETLRKTESLE
jgi:hypothetical protein